MLEENIPEGLTFDDVLLLPAHSMFSGDGASVIDAPVQYAHRQVDGNLLLARDRTVIQHQGMQVAIAGMEDIRDPQPGRGRHFCNLLEHDG